MPPRRPKALLLTASLLALMLTALVVLLSLSQAAVGAAEPPETTPFVAPEAAEPAGFAGPAPTEPALSQRLDQPVVGPPVRPYDSAQLNNSPTTQPPANQTLPELRPRLPSPHEPGAPQTDLPEAALLPSAPEAAADMPAPEVVMEGLSAADVGQILPPDPNGAAGLDHYVQVVNDLSGGARVAVYAKTGGPALYAFDLNELWPAGEENPCHDRPAGDPIVLYDRLANRWVLSQFTDLPAPFHECIAVSKTSVPANPAVPDPPHGWYAYTFEIHPVKFNDYPKLAAWTDAYYMTANQFVAPFASAEDYAGVGVWAFERDKMLAGQRAQLVYFDLETLNPNYFGLLPADLLGMRPPPAGAPGYFASVDQDWGGAGSADVLHLFEFHVNWADPLASIFAWVKDLEVAPFDWYISGFTFYTIPQPGISPRLDDLGDRLMMPLWYRNFGAYEALVVNHTIDVYNAPPSTFGLAGIRWYEVRGGAVDDTLADASLYQQGTLGSTAVTENRWMGSLAMDQAGNLALGYSVANSSIYPGIRYIGREAGDLPGTLPIGENTLIDGSGSQLYSRGRWGDYSSMTVDPVDDCTFWYTNEYIQTTGQVPWKTHITSFRFPSCTSAPNFFLSVDPGTNSVCVAGSADFAISLVDLNGFAEAVTLSGSGAPPAASLDFTPNPVSPGSPSTLTVSTAAETSVGSYSLVITGTTGTLTRTAYTQLNVLDNPPGIVELVVPINLAVEQPLQPTFRWLPTEDADSYTFELAADPGFTQLVHQAAGLSGSSYPLPLSLENNTTYFWRMRADNACGPGETSLVSSFTTQARPLNFFPILAKLAEINGLKRLYLPVSLLVGFP
ncbi:MAG: hypothetical protein ACK2UW_02945 [Anaerolineales bacterium]